MNTQLTLKTSLIINAPVADVWDALTNPEVIKTYFFGTNLITTWQEGSPILFEGEWEGTAYQDKGTVLSFQPESSLSYNYWSSFSHTEDIPDNYAIIEYFVEAVANGTKVTVTQDNLKDEAALAHSEKNWQMLLAEMAKLLENS